MDETDAQRTWRIDWPGIPLAVIGGPDRIEDVRADGNGARVRLSCAQPRPCWKLTNGGPKTFEPTFTGSADSQVLPLMNISACHQFPEAVPRFDDARWFTAPQPRPMAHFGHGHGWSWYRTTLHVMDPGPQMIYFSGAADHALAFIDGKFLARRGSHTHCGWHLMAPLPAGEHTLAMLVENLGMKNSGAEMEMPLGEPKGLFGPVWMNGIEIQGWRLRPGLRADEPLEYWPAVAQWDGWTAPAAGGLKGPLWLKAGFMIPAGFDGAVRLSLEQTGDKGSAWINGHNVGRYWRIGPQRSLWLPTSWLRTENTIVLMEENEIDPGKVQVELSPFGFSAEFDV